MKKSTVNMKLWKLYPRQKAKPWDFWPDKCHGFIIRSETEEQARKIAQDNAGDEKDYGDVWLDLDLCICIEILPEGNSEIILRDFRNG